MGRGRAAQDAAAGGARRPGGRAPRASEEGRGPHLEVDGQVEEVEVPPEALLDELQQHALCVLVGDVLDHQRRAPVLACGARRVLLCLCDWGNKGAGQGAGASQRAALRFREGLTLPAHCPARTPPTQMQGGRSAHRS